MGHAADGDDELVELRGYVTSLFLIDDGDARFVLLHILDLDAEVELQALLLELLQGFLADSVVGSHQETGEGFENRDLRAEATPDAAQFHTDHARADHAEACGHLLEGKSAAVFHDVPTEGGEGQFAGAAARRHNHVLCPHLSSGRVHDPALSVLPHQAAQTVNAGDLVLAKQEGHAAGQLVHHGFLAAQHFREVHPRAVYLDAVFGRLVVDHLEAFARIEHRLGGNAAHIEAGAAQRSFAAPLESVHAGRLEAQLCGANRGHVACRAAANHHYVVCVHNRSRAYHPVLTEIAARSCRRDRA